MVNSEKHPVGTVALALGAAVLGFILGARIKVGNHGATVIVMPIGGDLVIHPPASQPAVSPTEEAPEGEEERAIDQLQTDEV